MGSTTFQTSITVKKAVTTDTAFANVVSSAQHEHGAGGYSGTIAEKHSCVLVTKVKSKKNAQRIIDAFIHSSYQSIEMYREEVKESVDDKWGPASAVRFPVSATEDTIIFFGWASC
jgi:hypothetical protein